MGDNPTASPKMKPAFLPLFLASVGLILAACQKQDPASELEKAAAALAKTETAPVPPDPAAPPETAVVGSPPAQQVREAIVDFKAGKMEDAVTRLQVLRNSAALSPQQRMALQDSIAAVMTEVYTLAEKGDPRAIAAVAQYQRMQTAR
jgi:hypothetical protein